MINFVKMHGLGNDFILIDATKTPFVLTTQQIQHLSDRRLGVGFDQLLVIEPSHAPEIDFHYRIFNADGSEVGQCGNGARCVAKYIRDEKLSAKKELILSTIQTQLKINFMGNNVSVDMGIPSFLPKDLPLLHELANEYFLNLAGKNVAFDVVSMGNPHAVILVEDFSLWDIAHIGELLSHHPAFPKQVNVGFMQIQNTHTIHLRVYERGAGLTQACGSGACAAAAVAHKRSLTTKKMDVHQRGGVLQIEWPGNGQHLIMTGPAHFVYRGQVTLPS